jgi:hypothetical protein
MQYLIDGYNLLYAVGLLNERAGPKTLHWARQRLLGLLHAALGDRSSDATVVFDSGPQAPDFPREQMDQGIHVRFSEHPEKADDVIAQLIRRSSTPRALTVVSDDHEVQRAARRRNCPVAGCVDFMEGLGRLRRPANLSDTSQKPARLTDAELKDWLAAFGDLDASPEMQELAEPNDFLDFDPSKEED